MSEELSHQDLPTFRKVQALKDSPHLLGAGEGQGGGSTVPRNSVTVEWSAFCFQSIFHCAFLHTLRVGQGLAGENTGLWRLRRKKLPLAGCLLRARYLLSTRMCLTLASL